MNNNNGHEYVDFGLPSGTLWATCNVGAKNPEDYGDYFAWGEIRPKEFYKWNTYKFAQYQDTLRFTKYVDESGYGVKGYMDRLKNLQTIDDAATVNWGGNWCMPTKEHWEELLLNTNYHVWRIKNNVKGYLFTKNGQSLFLPAAGCREGYDLLGSDIRGYYWSSTQERMSVWAFCFFEFNMDCINSYKYYNKRFEIFGDISNGTWRYSGLSVRPVLLAK